MKKLFVWSVATMQLMVTAYMAGACTKSAAQSNQNPGNNQGNNQNNQHSVPIPSDQANEMIQSYLDGINSTVNTNKTRAFVCNADSLRAYLSNSSIKNVKLFLAHNMDWINGGYQGQQPGANDNALTIVIAGMDSLNNYVPIDTLMTAQGMVKRVLDRLDPCPDDCAGSTLLSFQ